MDDVISYLEIIRAAYPNLIVQQATIVEHGQNNVVVQIDENFVFRFPKYQHGLNDLLQETALLQAIGGFITLPIPQPIFVQLDGHPIGHAFVGYVMIPGQPLWRETFELTSSTTRQSLAHQLGTFLAELHAIPVTAALSQTLPRYDTKEEWLDIFRRIRQRLLPAMRAEAREWTTQHFERFLGNNANFAYTPVLRHGDFGTGNILVNEDVSALQGIIDFGHAGLGDRAYDFAGLTSSYGEAFVGQMQSSYPMLPTLWERIRFYAGTFALLEALFGAENGDAEAYESGIAPYR